MTQTPQEHSSLVGGSTAARRLNCPGSYKREKIAPKSKGSSYAREGTALHEMMAKILDANMLPSELLPFTHNQPAKGVEEEWTLTIEQDVWDDLGQPALDMFDAFLNGLEVDQEGAAATYMVEERSEFPGIPGAFGTSDVPFRCGKIGGILDWKFGRGPVGAADNAQLLFYFRALLAKHPKFFEGIDRVMLVIVQPRVNRHQPDIWETTIDDVMAFELELHDAIALAQTDDAPIERGPWCKFADCKTVCELHISASVRLGEKMAQLKIDNPTVRQAAIGVDMGTFLSEAMELAEMAEDWAKHVAKVAQDRLEAGLPIEGWKIVQKRSPGRGWNPEMSEKEIINRLRSRGLKADDYYNKTLCTPPQAEKKLKLLDKELPEDAVVVKPSNGFTLTREGDPRHGAAPLKEKAAAIGSSLQRLLEQKA